MEQTQPLAPYKKFIFLAIIVVAFHSFGVVLIAVGGLFFIIGMRKKQLEDE